jgi:hypothetical protein
MMSFLGIFIYTFCVWLLGMWVHNYNSKKVQLIEGELYKLPSGRIIQLREFGWYNANNAPFSKRVIYYDFVDERSENSALIVDGKGRMFMRHASKILEYTKKY